MGNGSGVLSVLGSLALVVGILVLAYWCTKYIAGRGGALPSYGKGLELVCRLPLGKGESLAVVRAAERYLLIGVTAGGVSLLTELTSEEAGAWLQGAGGGQTPPSFLDAMGDAVRRRKK